MEEESSSAGDEESERSLWLAAFIVGGILILMFVAIAVIVLWKCLKKPNTTDQNWAGPSPLADGEIPEGISNTMKEPAPPRKNLSISCIHPITVMFSKSQMLLEDMSNEVPQNVEEESSDTKSATAGKFSIPVPPTVAGEKSLSAAPMNQPIAIVPTDYSNLPPPPDYLLELPMPPLDDALPDSPLSVNPLLPFPSTLPSSANEIQDHSQMLPPPPPELQLM
ncbi:hypothetical protein FKM82_008820 [Ascaphus truei]